MKSLAGIVVVLLVSTVVAYVLYKGVLQTTNSCSWVYQLQDADPVELSKMADIVVIDYSRDGTDAGMYSREEISEAKKNAIVLAYLSIGEAEDYRFYWRDGADYLGPENPEWEGNYAVKYWTSEWMNVVDSYIDRLLSQGFDGVYLDKVDEFEFWSSMGYDEKWLAHEMANLIRHIKERVPIVVIQNGERILDYEYVHPDGWAFEDLMSEPDRWRYLSMNTTKLSVEYSEIDGYLDFARKYGLVPYISNISLSEPGVVFHVRAKCLRDHLVILSDLTCS